MPSYHLFHLMLIPVMWFSFLTYDFLINLEINLIPKPQHLTQASGFFSLNYSTGLLSDSLFKQEEIYLKDLLSLPLKGKKNKIILSLDYKNNRFPMPNDVMGRDNVAVGRIRTDISQPHGLELWLCGDQIRKGAALNAVQIAELLIPKK